jgi:uncharacterized SAM-binding protein YcdF (DUF218 family)
VGRIITVYKFDQFSIKTVKMRDYLTKDHLINAKVLWNFLRVGGDVSKSDLIIGLGSYDLRVADRCVELLNTRMAEKILFSGAAGNWTHGLWKKTEAEIFEERALASGVGPEKILVENESTNIGDNIRFCKSMLQKKGCFPKTVIFVTKPQTERRVWLTVAKEWNELGFSVTSPQIDFADQPLPHHSTEDLINEMVGDLQRIIVYADRGWQQRQEIPKNVQEAYKNLIDLGYDKHMLKM